MRIAMLGTRGVPARYGGFETAVEEIGSRLVSKGHEVIVYCRGDDPSRTYRGMHRVRLPAVQHKVAETLTHTALSAVHLARHRTDVAILFNAANGPVIPLVRARRIPVAVHVDGLEWRRAKWGSAGRRYYLANERLCVRLSDRLIADAEGIRDYYRNRYSADSVFLPYGAPLTQRSIPSRVAQLGLSVAGYHLVVTRLEPENHVDVIVEGFRQSSASRPLVVVGSVPYETPYQARIKDMASSDSRIRLLGAVWDQELLDDLYASSLTYLHGHSVGGTNPSLLRAMGAGASTIAWDVEFNREVLADTGLYFDSASTLSGLIEASELHQDAARARGAASRSRAAAAYRWDDVADGYEDLCKELAAKCTRPRQRS